MQPININTMTWVNGRSRLNQTNMNKIEGNLELLANKVNELVTFANESQAAVQSDWTENNADSLAYIKHKPSIPAAQVQSDWNETSTSAKSYILNKPTIPDAQVQSNWNESDSSSKAYIQNKPTIPAPQIQSNWTQADSAKLDFIKNKPTIPTDTGDLTNGAGFITSSALSGYATETYVQGYVAANPASTTGTLTAIAIGGVSYAVPQGGGGGGMNNPMTDSGDIIYGGAAGAPSRLAKGADGQVLTLSSGVPSWQTPQSGGMANPMTTTGDIIVGGTSGAPTRLAKGADGKILKMVSGSVAWGDAPAAGVTDVTVGGTSVVSGGVAAVPAIPTVPTNVSAFTNDAGYLTAHQSIKTLDGDTLTGSGALKTGKLEKLVVGAFDGYSSTLVSSADLDRYSSLLLTGHSQYADGYEQVWTVNVADIKNGTVTLTRTIPGWNDPLNLYLYIDSGYLRWNGGNNHIIYMTSIVGMCPNA